MAPRLGYLFPLTCAVLLPTGCGGDPTCPQWAFPAVTVRATSAASAAPLLDARGEVRDGGYRDSLENVFDGTYHAATNRPGTYSVHLEQAGYFPWDTTGITAPAVGGDVCTTVETQTLEARLAPVP